MTNNRRGQNRVVTDDLVRKIREWKSLAQIARDAGISPKTAANIRAGYQHKRPSP